MLFSQAGELGSGGDSGGSTAIEWYSGRVGDDDEVRIAATRTDELRFKAIPDRPIL
jgi:hypothetical protein